MEVKMDFVLRDIAGDLLLIPAGKAALDLNGMLTLNEVGGEIWRLLPELYEVEESELRKDVADFLDSLRKLGIL